eukprot:CAMPEP_0206572468 /NCGR_PEP_ID=MMETSP0325_2-20121206/28268_1 /ASSEMBLY_ACC=CAM_ASM_000347 /TAXON_ID=2866 /ORGANISM="Crypthecodinium cohnii, Strain Seligo" /LENGTH=683 /DNA_ID=CAMNT_0054076687 /DNA_START=61 /DNA_END=2113 /DNA_ORIENTATION=-
MAAVVLTPSSSTIRDKQSRMVPVSPASNEHPLKQMPFPQVPPPPGNSATSKATPKVPPSTLPSNSGATTTTTTMMAGTSSAAAAAAAQVATAAATAVPMVPEEQPLAPTQQKLQPQTVPPGCLCECWAGLEKYLPVWMMKKPVAVVDKTPSIDPALMKEISESLPPPVEMPTLLQSLRPEEGKEGRRPSSRRHGRVGTEASSLISTGEDSLVVYSPKSTKSLVQRDRALPPVALVPSKEEKGNSKEDAREIVMEGDLEVVPMCALFPSAPLPELSPGAREFLQVARSFIVDTSRRLETGTNDLIRWSWPHLVTAANGLQYYALEAASRTGDVVMHGWESWRVNKQGLGDQPLQGPNPPSTRASSLVAVGDSAMGHAEVMPRIESLGAGSAPSSPYARGPAKLEVSRHTSMEGSTQPEPVCPSPSPDVPPLPHKQGTISLHSMRSSRHGGASPASVRSAPAFVQPRQPGPRPSTSAARSPVAPRLPSRTTTWDMDLDGPGPTTADAAAAAASALAAVAAANAALGHDTPIGLTPAAADASPAVSGRSFGTLSRPSRTCPPPPLPTAASGELSVSSRTPASPAPPLPGRMRSGMVVGPLPGIDHSISNRSIVSNRSGGAGAGWAESSRAGVQGLDDRSKRNLESLENAERTGEEGEQATGAPGPESRHVQSPGVLAPKFLNRQRS